MEGPDDSPWKCLKAFSDILAPKQGDLELVRYLDDNVNHDDADFKRIHVVRDKRSFRLIIDLVFENHEKLICVSVLEELQEFLNKVDLVLQVMAWGTEASEDRFNAFITPLKYSSLVSREDKDGLVHDLFFYQVSEGFNSYLIHDFVRNFSRSYSEVHEKTELLAFHTDHDDILHVKVVFKLAEQFS